MSVFKVNHLCREVMRDPAFREALRRAPQEALAGYDLTEEERSALLSGDVGKLHRLGVNSFLMGYLARFEVLGLDIRTYGERMRLVHGHETGH